MSTIKSRIFSVTKLIASVVGLMFLVYIAVLMFMALEWSSYDKESIQGVVTNINWVPNGVGMPVIEVETPDSGKKIFSNHRILLTEEHIKVGDEFVKIENTSDCIINELRVVCLK